MRAGDVLDVTLPPEPPVGAVIRDRHGAEWPHEDGGWPAPWADEDDDVCLCTWREVCENGPVTVVSLPHPTTLAVPEEPPVGSIVRDSEGYEWRRWPGGWTTDEGDVHLSWLELFVEVGCTPLVVVRWGAA